MIKVIFIVYYIYSYYFVNIYGGYFARKIRECIPSCLIYSLVADILNSTINLRIDECSQELSALPNFAENNLFQYV